MVDEGVRRAYTNPDNPLRASIVADPAGTRKNTRDNTPSVVHIDMVAGNHVEVMIAAKGGGSENKSKVGSTKIRFLKNTIDFENGNKLKEGFVFQRNMKTNPETAIDGFLEFQIDKSGVPLKWRSGLDNYIEAWIII